MRFDFFLTIGGGASRGLASPSNVIADRDLVPDAGVPAGEKADAGPDGSSSADVDRGRVEPGVEEVWSKPEPPYDEPSVAP